MDLDNLREIWREQEEAESAMDEDALLAEVHRRGRKFRRTIFWRDVREVGAGLLVAAIFVFYGTRTWGGSRIWTWHVAAALVLGVSIFMVVDRILQRREPPGNAESVTESTRAYLRELNHQIWLLRNVFWWYLLPPGVGLLLVCVHIALAQGAGPVPAVMFIVVLVVFAGVYWVNQVAVRTVLEPQRAKLEALLRNLEAPDAQPYSVVRAAESLVLGRTGEGDKMKRFIVGLVLGVFLGALGTICVVAKMATPAPEPVVLELPDAPIADAEKLTSFLEQRPYEIGYYAKNLRTGKTVERYADRPVCLASIVKLFCVTELFRQKHDEALDLNQKIDVPGHGAISLAEAADLMIGRSDNAATQALTGFLGREKVNSIPALLGIDAMSAEILPDEKTLRQTLDKRVFGDRVAKAGLPQHGTARGMGAYLELLLNKKAFSESISTEMIDFLSGHPKPFSTHYAGRYEFAGKGGNLLWTRPPKHYSMMGWGLFVKTQKDDDIVLCVWGEWFPEDMPPESQSKFLKYVTDSVISIVES